jgi:hypothetical protein
MELDQSANDLPITIASTVSRASYGIVCRQLFDKSRHLAADKFWCEIEGRWRAVNQMEWYLKRVN